MIVSIGFRGNIRHIRIQFVLNDNVFFGLQIIDIVDCIGDFVAHFHGAKFTQAFKRRCFLLVRQNRVHNLFQRILMVISDFDRSSITAIRHHARTILRHMCRLQHLHLQRNGSFFASSHFFQLPGHSSAGLLSAVLAASRG